MRYLIVLTASARRLTPTTFAAESAFVEHVRAMKRLLAPRFDSLVVAMTEMSDAEYQAGKSSYSVVDEKVEHIVFESLLGQKRSHLKFIHALPALVRKLTRLVAQADLVHSHPSHDVLRPVELIASALAVVLKKKLVTVSDIDNREAAAMSLRAGISSRKSFLIAKCVSDPFRHAQHRAYVKHADLVLFKEPAQIADYGRGADHVRLFIDTAYETRHVVTDAVVEQRIARLSEPGRPLRAIYFGRVVPYKGVDKMIEAVGIARKAGANVTLDVLGNGSDVERLKKIAADLGASDAIRWLQPVPYGPLLFAELGARDLLLACPLSPDTPRSAWDALACGMPIVAFDTPYYERIASVAGAAKVVPWPNANALAEQLVMLANDKSRLAPLMRNAVTAARSNTNDRWLQQRATWIETLFAEPARAAR